MRATLALGISGLALLFAGCSLVGSGVDHVAYGTRECWEDRQERARDRRWAEHAWIKWCAAQPGTCYSADYADGFKEGFAHYLYAGGTGEPPPLPPRRYRAVAYQTPKGYHAIEDWFEGYRQGSAAARQGPFRDWITGPSALRGQAQVPPPAILPPAEAAPPPEQLPPPMPPASGPAADQATGAAGAPHGDSAPQPAAPGPAADQADATQQRYFPTSWRPLGREGQTAQEGNDPSPGQ